MQAMQSLSRKAISVMEDDRQEALDRCSDLLEEERFSVSWVSGPPLKGGVRPHDILATKFSHAVRVLVLLERDVDSAETRDRIRSALEQGETRVCVPWPLKWRALSNLESWGLHGVAVMSL